MRVFVTGASGFIGSAVVAQLLASGHRAVGLARSERSAAAIATAGGEVHRGTLEDLDVTSLASVLLDLLRSKLQVKMHSRSNPLALRKSTLQHLGIHVHVGHFAARAGAAVCRINPDFFD